MKMIEVYVILYYYITHNVYSCFYAGMKTQIYWNIKRKKPLNRALAVGLVSITKIVSKPFCGTMRGVISGCGNIIL